MLTADGYETRSSAKLENNDKACEDTPMVRTPEIANLDRYLSLKIPPALTLNVSQEQFVALSEANRDLRLETTAKGELLANPPTGWETGEQNVEMAADLVIWNRNTKLGKVFDSSTGFRLPNGANRSPDASWVSLARWYALSDKQKSTFAEICPDFAIELRSRSDALKPLQDKMQEYLDNGMRLGWLIDPRNRRVEIYRCDRNVERLENPTTLSGEEVLPGFVLEVLF